MPLIKQSLITKLRIPTRSISSIRSPPRSLLEKQARRLQNKHGEDDAVSNVNTQELLSNSMDDILNLFKPNAMSEVDETLLRKNYDATLDKLLTSGQFDDLMKHKFQMINGTLNIDALNKQFKILKPLELDLLNFAMTKLTKPEDDWNKMDTHLKQLQYYFAYGSYGPRENYNDFKKDSNETKWFQLDTLSKTTIGLFLTISITALIKNSKPDTEVQSTMKNVNI